MRVAVIYKLVGPIEFPDRFITYPLIQHAMERDFDYDYNTRPMGFWEFILPFALASMVIGALVYLITGFL